MLVGRHHEGTSSTDIFLFHGLTGDAEASYILRITELALKRGHSVYRINHRGCGEGAGRARLPYHSGRGEDLSEVMQQVHQVRPQRRQIAIGFSLGANALLTLMSRIRGRHLPDAAIAVNPPIDLGQVARALETGLNRIYDVNFVFLLRRMLKSMHHQGLLEQKVSLSPWLSLRGFDEMYTAPMGGFRNNEDYYAQCSTWNRLDRIDKPTVILTAQDDPFIHYEAFGRTRPSKHVLIHASEQGGHLGYLTREKTPLGSHRWLDYAIDEFLTQLEKT